MEISGQMQNPSRANIVTGDRLPFYETLVAWNEKNQEARCPDQKGFHCPFLAGLYLGRERLPRS
jgi:hypothetical protein